MHAASRILGANQEQRLTSQRLMALMARPTDSGSAPSGEEATEVRRLMPAVSTSVKREPSGATSSVSTASRVVPLTGLTMARCSPVCAWAGLRQRPGSRAYIR